MSEMDAVASVVREFTENISNHLLSIVRINIMCDMIQICSGFVWAMHGHAREPKEYRLQLSYYAAETY